MTEKILYTVHCIDAEGPLDESLDATFKRLEDIFGLKLEASVENLRQIQAGTLGTWGLGSTIAKCFSPRNLKYNRNWKELELMLNDVQSNNSRKEDLDDFGNGWIYSWHCVDHVGLTDNPRKKAYGFSKIFEYYNERRKIESNAKDEINWHFHPLSILRNPLDSATSYTNCYDLLNQILCRRIIDHGWFPVVNRPGFHSERPDSHLFLEQWIPFDYANQAAADYQDEDQPDLLYGRFGDWRRAPREWRPYNPHHDDYQSEGNCRRLVFPCLNVGTRTRTLKLEHIREAFDEAGQRGKAILAVASHDFRDMRDDINELKALYRQARNENPGVKIKYMGAEQGARAFLGFTQCAPLKLSIEIRKNLLLVSVENGEIFGPQPFLAIQSKDGHYFHDNFDCIAPSNKWSYTFDNQTIVLNDVKSIGVGSAGRFGGYDVVRLDIQR